MRKLLSSMALLAFTILLGFNLQAEEYGVASYYSDSFQGRKTASGEPYDMNKLTCAHKSYAFGTILKVTRLDNKSSVRVRVNDRGPYIKGRIVDLSKKAADRLGILEDGKARVKIEVLNGAKELAEDVTPPTPSKKEIVKEVVEAKKEAPKPKSYDSSIAKPAQTNKVVEAVKKTNVKPSPKKAEPVATKTKEGQTKPWVTYSKVKGSDFQPYDLYKIDLFRPERIGYGVQVYSISNYESVIRQVAELQEKWFSNILVSVEKGKDGKPSYKIILGPFKDRKTADSYKKRLKKKKKIDGFVVDLSAKEYPRS